MKKYEYLLVNKNCRNGFNSDTETLEQLGSEGWELCGISVEYDDNGIARNVFYFKRENENNSIIL